MSTPSVSILLSFIALSAAGCMPGESQHGVREHVKTRVVFLSQDQEPLAGELVWIIETVGMRYLPTKSVRTNGQGAIILDDDFCLPIIVGMDGGYADVRLNGHEDQYTVQVNASRTPSVIRLYGQPPADIIRFKRSGTYKNCGGS